MIDNPDEDTLSEDYINGYDLNALEGGQAYAIKILRINTELHPDSAITSDSLTYAYQQAGDKEHAVENFRNALKLNPGFASAL